MKSKLQKIPESVWMKLQRIQQLKEGWNMMTIVNECLDLGANYLIKKLTKKSLIPESDNRPTINDSHNIDGDNIITEEQLKKEIEIAKTPIPWAFKDD